VVRKVLGRAASVAVVVGLAVTALAVPALASTSSAVPTAQQGVSKDAIEIVLIVPDIDALVAKGVVPSNRSTAEFSKRFTAMSDAYGPINGREIVVKPVAWDPLDVTSFDRVCTEATQDNKPFLVVNGSGYQTSSIPCISVDNKTPFFTGDMTYDLLQKGSGKNLVSINLPSEVAARSAAKVVAKTGVVPKKAKIGILSNNNPGIKAAGDAMQSELKKLGYDVVSKVEINGLANDVGVLGREGAAAVTTFQGEGVDTVFNVQVPLSGFFNEVERTGAEFKVYQVDGQANTCQPTSVGATTSGGATGVTCITPWNARSVPTKDAIKTDTPLEAKCRKAYEAALGVKTQPGGGQRPINVNGVDYLADMTMNECNIANVLFPAIKAAGKDVTWDKVYANLMKTTKAPSAYLGKGEGGFGKNKPYFAKPEFHFETVVHADANTPKDANGLFDGCATPQTCLIPQLVKGQEWFTP